MKRVGSHRALRALIEQHDVYIRWRLRSYGVYVHELDDLMQDVWIRVWQHRSSVRHATGMSSWILSIARNLAISRFRKEGRYTFIEIDSVAPPQTLPDETFITTHDFHVVVRAMRTLPKRIQRLVFFVDYADQPISEAAKKFGIHETTVRRQLTRARERIRQCIQST